MTKCVGVHFKLEKHGTSIRHNLIRDEEYIQANDDPLKGLIVGAVLGHFTLQLQQR